MKAASGSGGILPSFISSIAIGSLDLTSPECTVSMKYTQKWYLIMSVPINLAIIFFVAHCVLWFKHEFDRVAAGRGVEATRARTDVVGLDDDGAVVHEHVVVVLHAGAVHKGALIGEGNEGRKQKLRE